MRNRLSIKINLLMSFGKKITGVVDDKQIDKLMNCTNGLGVYEIIYDTLKVYPISLIKISDSNYENLPGSPIWLSTAQQLVKLCLINIGFSIKIIETIR
jgi:hypothetical protein